MNKYEKLRSLLQEMIDAGDKAILPLDMLSWHCGTSCCLCGDVAVARGKNENYDAAARVFSDELDDSSFEVFGYSYIASSIYTGAIQNRFLTATHSELLTKGELNHPHLNTDHSDRAIAHDYIRLIMRKVDEKELADELAKNGKA